jgi:hypothetical protein
VTPATQPNRQGHGKRDFLSDYSYLEFEYNCPSCHEIFPLEIQFTLGERDYHRYHIGDRINWRHDFPGDLPSNPLSTKLIVHGIGSPDPILCPRCSELVAPFSQEWNILIEGDVIKSVSKISDVPKPDSLLSNEIYRFIE